MHEESLSVRKGQKVRATLTVMAAFPELERDQPAERADAEQAGDVA
jgi:hypothetical protein